MEGCWMNGIGICHQKEYSKEPSVIVEAPQVTTLLGAFSDSINGYALMSTNDYGMRIAISKRDDNVVRVLNVTKQDKKKFLISNIKYRKEDRWANCAKAILQEFSNAGYQLSGMYITIKGPGAIGDSHSLAAAIFAGLAVGINELYKLNLSADDLLKLSFGANRFSKAYQARLRDLITLFTSQKGSVIFFDLDSYNYKIVKYPFNDPESGIATALISTALPYSVLTPEMDEFRENIDALVLSVKDKIPRGVKLRDLSELQVRQDLNLRVEAVRSQLMYVIEESELAKKGYEALVSGDYAAFGKVLNSLQKNLLFKAELTCPEIDWVVKKTNSAEGIYGLSQVFVGLSGTLIALIDSRVDFPYTSRLEEYERIFGFHAFIRPYLPSGGVRRIEKDEDSSC